MSWKKEKGFTLIELLSVIVILGIIMLIATPLVLNVIKESRYSSFGISKKNIERAAELYYTSNSNDISWDGNIAYVTIGDIKTKGYLKKQLINNLNNLKIDDDIKILLYKEGDSINYALQLYEQDFFNWYRIKMVNAAKMDKDNLPDNVGDKKNIELYILMDKKLVDELRLPLDLQNRCVGFVEIEKIKNNKYEYNAFLDCLEEASSFASHYVSFGGKAIDNFTDVKETSDGGYIAVGESNSDEYFGNKNKGNTDAIIVKFSKNGKIEWSKNFGGSNSDLFSSVVESPYGYIVVGQTRSNDGDLDGLLNITTSRNALIVKYDKDGKEVFKKTYGESGSNSNIFSTIIKINDGYVIAGRIDLSKGSSDFNTTNRRLNEAALIKLDNNLNVVWSTFFGGSADDAFTSVKETSDNGYIAVGGTQSKDGDLQGIGSIMPMLQTDAFIVKFNSKGELEYKQTFKGEVNDWFNDVIEVDDGYIAIGYSYSSDLEMSDVSKTQNIVSDGIIVKYNKELSNVIFKKSFGGSSDDSLDSLIKISNKEIIAVGYTKSDDFDLTGIYNDADGYKGSVLIKFNSTNGEILTTQIFGGSSSDKFNKIIQTKDNNYVIAGYTFSADGHLRNFNKGHSDAILVSYDNKLELTKAFQEPVVLIDKLKQIIPNYGDKIEDKYTNLYTSNNPGVDLTDWCNPVDVYKNGNTSNYYYGDCLRPFNSDNLKTLTVAENSAGLMNVNQNKNIVNIVNKPTNINNWNVLMFYFAYSGGQMEISNLKLKFEDNYIGSIQAAVNKGYIEPLVTINSSVDVRMPGLLFPTVFDLINDNGTTGEASYPIMYINIKPKKSKLIGIEFDALRNVSTNYDGVKIFELRDFDMSITPTT